MLLHRYSFRKNIWDIKSKNLEATPHPQFLYESLTISSMLDISMKRNRDDQGNESSYLPMVAITMLASSFRGAWPDIRQEEGTLRPRAQIQQSLGNCTS